MGMVNNSNEKVTPTNPPDVEVTNKIQPKTRLEKFLAKIAKREDIENLEPKTRLEYFLNKIAMEDSDETLEPKTRLEYFLNEIAENKETIVIPSQPSSSSTYNMQTVNIKRSTNTMFNVFYPTIKNNFLEMETININDNETHQIQTAQEYGPGVGTPLLVAKQLGGSYIGNFTITGTNSKTIVANSEKFAFVTVFQNETITLAD